MCFVGICFVFRSFIRNFEAIIDDFCSFLFELGYN